MHSTRLTVQVLLLTGAVSAPACVPADSADIKADEPSGPAAALLVPDAVRLPPAGGTYTSAVHGGAGGAPFSIRCPVNEYAIGIYGRSGAYVDRLGLICASITGRAGLQKMGAGHLIGAAGGSGGADFTILCPQPYSAMAGLMGRSAEFLDAVAPLCRDIAFGIGSRIDLRGGSGGSGFSDEFWPGLVQRISGRAGNYIDSIGYESQPMEFRVSAKEAEGGY